MMEMFSVCAPQYGQSPTTRGDWVLETELGPRRKEIVSFMQVSSI